MKLSEIQEMVDVDLKIDTTQLTNESVNTPLLFNKYYAILLNQHELLKRAEAKLNKVYKEKYDYYTGQAPDEEYVRKPFNRKVLKSDVDSYILTDDEYIQYDELVNKQRHKTKYVEEVIKQINQRTYHIKSIIESEKFKAGGY